MAAPSLWARMRTSSYQGKAYVYSRSGSTYALATTLSDPAATNNDYFGSAVALSADGNTLAVGAYGTSSSQGKAYVYTNPPPSLPMRHDPANRDGRNRLCNRIPRDGA